MSFLGRLRCYFGEVSAGGDRSLNILWENPTSCISLRQPQEVAISTYSPYRGVRLFSILKTQAFFPSTLSLVI